MRYELGELRTLVGKLEDDLHAQVESLDGVEAGLRSAHQDAVDHSRTGDEFEQWLDGYLTQVAVAWVLTCTFVRFLEDNKLVRGVWLAGEGRAAEEATDRTDAYFREHPAKSETDYLLHVFEHFAGLPAGELFGSQRNALYRVKLSADAGRTLLHFWREINVDAEDTPLKREFHDAGRDTRFLGDLYQDLSEYAKKTFALLQTPDFVEDYILDYTLEPAVETFGLDAVRFIDPTCGSGHFLLGGFKRLFNKRLGARPGSPRAELVREALEATHGVDLNPFAVAVARFRLLIAALTAVSESLLLDDAPDFPLQIAVGDTLLHGRRFERFVTDATKNIAQLELDRFKWDPERWSTEDNDLIEDILGQQYHAVVGNPPYITPKDKAARDAYRDLYASCYRQYALVCPFYERFFELAGGECHGEDMFSGARWPHAQAGFVGQIVANSFMKREFGSKLIESIIPNTDLTHVIDTSGAYIPGHGTPTVILFGRNQESQGEMVRAVLGIRGEPKTPEDPRTGKVWSSIASNTDNEGFENDFVTVSDLSREILGSHPWSLRGGGALEIKQALEGELKVLDTVADSVGFMCITKQDDVFVQTRAILRRTTVEPAFVRDFGIGEDVRDWSAITPNVAVFPYDDNIDTVEAGDIPGALSWMWRFRTPLGQRKVFGGKNYFQVNKPWYEYGQIPRDRFTPLTITFAFVATHNHFVLDRGGKVFNRSAPVIKLPADATEDDHLGLLGLLNSSTGCFWMKQVFFDKGSQGINEGLKAEFWEKFFEHDGTKIKQFPLAEERPLALGTRLDKVASKLASIQPGAGDEVPNSAALDKARSEDIEISMQMVALQEELDWRCYELYGLLEAGEAPLSGERELPGVQLGQRAFEIVIARKMAAGDVSTSWFTRHGSTPITEIPSHWPQWYQDLVQRRIELIEQRRFIRLIEQPEYKRRWNRDSWEDKEQEALRSWLLDRLESPAYVPQTDRDGPGAATQATLVRISDLADLAAADPDFMAVAERYTGNATFSVLGLVEDLLKTECVPFLPAQRYKKGGIKKRRQWEKVWDLQRREDAGEQVKIPKPPKYTGADFTHNSIYKLRGKLDVPKERFTLYKGLEHDGHTYVTWAGLDHKQRAQALATFYYTARNEAGLEPEQLTLALAGIWDLVPWVKQWHNDLDPEYGIRFGDYIESFVHQQAAELGVGIDAVEKARL